MKNFVLKLTMTAALVAMAGSATAGGFVGGIFKENAAYKNVKGPVYSTYAVNSACNATSPAVTVTVNTQNVLRLATPPGIFGFTLDWYWFQLGYLQNNTPLSQVVSWLAPLKGATYRYSGGNQFVWSNAVGSIANRKPIGDGFFGNQMPLFGPAEFFNFLKTVNGQAVILMNVADYPLDENQMVQDNMAYLKWLATNGPHCVSGPNCPITYFELGNELDTPQTAPIQQYSAAQYIARVKPLILAAKAAYPGIKFAVLGRTAPWGGETDSAGQNFDQVVSSQLAPIVDAVTIHPYYDGIDIPGVQSYIDRLANLYHAINPAVKILVTEHARWPSMPATGPWQNNWYQGSGTGGGLSTADFLLMSMTDPNVIGTEWQTLATMGPWELIHKDAATNTVYPSGVYWAARTLREGFLNDVVQVSPATVSGTSYYGGYDIRMVAMKNSTGNTSLMGVNRSGIARVLTLKTKGIPPGTVKMEVAVTQGDQIGTDNIDTNQNKFYMKTATYNYSPVTSAPGVCIPPYSTFSIILGDRYK